MKHWLVDTNVLLDVIGADPEFGAASRDTLERCAESGMLVINPIVYAEVSVFIDSIEEVDRLLSPAMFRRDPLPWDAAFLAGKALRRHRRQGGSDRRILADFLIGAHAAVSGFTLVTRDRGYARHFYLDVLDPTT